MIIRLKASAAVRCTSAFLILVLSGCNGIPFISSNGELPDTLPGTRVVLEVSVAEDANPDNQERRLPISVSVYEIKAPSEFKRQDFFQLAESEPTLVSQGYARLDRYDLVGGEALEREQILNDAATHLGVVAGYRLLDQSNWQSVVAIQPGTINYLQLSVERLSLDLKAVSPPNE